MSTEPLRRAGALIVDDHGRIFIRRPASGAWGIVSGLAGADESLDEALRRVVTGETGWALSVVLATIGRYAHRGSDGVDRIETGFLVRVDGDLDRPRLAEGERTECRWITPAEMDLLDDQMTSGDGVMRRMVADGFAALRDIGVI